MSFRDWNVSCVTPPVGFPSAFQTVVSVTQAGTKPPFHLQKTYSKNKKETYRFWSLGFWPCVPGNLAYPDCHRVPTVFPIQDLSIYQESIKRFCVTFLFILCTWIKIRGQLGRIGSLSTMTVWDQQLPAEPSYQPCEGS